MAIKGYFILSLWGALEKSGKVRSQEWKETQNLWNLSPVIISASASTAGAVLTFTWFRCTCILSVYRNVKIFTFPKPKGHTKWLEEFHSTAMSHDLCLFAEILDFKIIACSKTRSTGERENSKVLRHSVNT